METDPRFERFYYAVVEIREGRYVPDFTRIKASMNELHEEHKKSARKDEDLNGRDLENNSGLLDLMTYATQMNNQLEGSSSSRKSLFPDRRSIKEGIELIDEFIRDRWIIFQDYLASEAVTKNGQYSHA